MVAKRGMAGLSGSVIELSNYLETRISQKSTEYAAVSVILNINVSLDSCPSLGTLPPAFAETHLLTLLSTFSNRPPPN